MPQDATEARRGFSSLALWALPMGLALAEKMTRNLRRRRIMGNPALASLAPEI